MLQLLPILCHYREDKELDDVILKNHKPRLNLRFSFSYRRNARKRGTISAHSELMVFKFSSNSNSNNHNHNDNNKKIQIVNTMTCPMLGIKEVTKVDGSI